MSPLSEQTLNSWWETNQVVEQKSEAAILKLVYHMVLIESRGGEKASRNVAKTAVACLPSV